MQMEIDAIMKDKKHEDMCKAISRLAEFYNEFDWTNMPSEQVSHILHEEVFPAFTRADPWQVMAAVMAIHEWFKEVEFRELVFVKFIDFVLKKSLLKPYSSDESNVEVDSINFNLFDRLRKWM